jgi:PAS domain S-box-containing protein
VSLDSLLQWLDAYDDKLNQLGIPSSFAAALLLLTLALVGFLVWNIRLRVRTQQAATQMERFANTLPGALFEYYRPLNSPGHFRYISPSVRSITGYRPEEILANSDLIKNRIHPDDLSRLANAIQGLKQRADKNLFVELRIQKASGDWRWIQSTAAQQDADEYGSIWSGYLFDITDRKQLELTADRLSITQQENQAISRMLKDKESLVAELLNENKTAATGALSASIAHELNQPLGASSLNIQFLKMQLERNELSPSLGKEILDNLDDDNKRAVKIIQTLRGIFLDHAPPTEVIDPNEQIQGVLSVMRPAILNENISLELQFSAGLRAAIHKNELQQVVMNLVKNAIEALASNHAEEKHSNTSHSQPIHSQPKLLSICSIRIGDRLQLSFTDNGRGISPEKSASLFSLLNAQDLEDKGLGLWLVQHIVTRYGGTIWHEQPSTQGSRFIVEIPAHLEQSTDSVTSTGQSTYS